MISAVKRSRKTSEHGHWHCHARVDKYLGDVQYDEHGRADRPTYEVTEVDGNILLTAGITRLLNLLAGLGGTAFNATNCRLGVGDGSTAVLIGDTDLSAAAGSTHRQFKLVDLTPAVAANVLTLHATFATGDANFAWGEFGIDNGTADGTTVVAPLLNRKVSSLGTKTAAASWALTVTITIT